MKHGVSDQHTARAARCTTRKAWDRSHVACCMCMRGPSMERIACWIEMYKVPTGKVGSKALQASIGGACTKRWAGGAGLDGARQEQGNV